MRHKCGMVPGISLYLSALWRVLAKVETTLGVSETGSATRGSAINVRIDDAGPGRY